MVDNFRLEAHFSSCDLYHIDSLSYMPVTSKSQCACEFHLKMASLSNVQQEFETHLPCRYSITYLCKCNISGHFPISAP